MECATLKIPSLPPLERSTLKLVLWSYTIHVNQIQKTINNVLVKSFCSNYYRRSAADELDLKDKYMVVTLDCPWELNISVFDEFRLDPSQIGNRLRAPKPIRILEK